MRLEGQETLPFGGFPAPAQWKFPLSCPIRASCSDRCVLTLKLKCDVPIGRLEVLDYERCAPTGTQRYGTLI